MLLITFNINFDGLLQFLYGTLFLPFKDLDPEDILTGDILALDPILTSGDHEVDLIPQNIGVEGAEATLLCLTEEGTLAAEYVV